MLLSWDISHLISLSLKGTCTIISVAHRENQTNTKGKRSCRIYGEQNKLLNKVSTILADIDWATPLLLKYKDASFSDAAF